MLCQGLAGCCPHCRSTGAHILQANGTAGATETPDNEVLPGPPPKAQPWMSNPAAHASGVNAMHPATHGAPHPGYGAEYYFQPPGGHAAHLAQPVATTAAEDDRYTLDYLTRSELFSFLVCIVDCSSWCNM